MSRARLRLAGMTPMHDLDSASLGAVLKTALDGVVVMRLDGTVAGWKVSVV